MLARHFFFHMTDCVIWGELFLKYVFSEESGHFVGYERLRAFVLVVLDAFVVFSRDAPIEAFLPELFSPLAIPFFLLLSFLSPPRQHAFPI